MVSPEGVEYQAWEDETAQILLSGTSGKAKPAGALFERGTSAYASRFFSATADSLREKRERRLVSRIFASWNHLNEWLRQIERLRRAA